MGGGKTAIACAVAIFTSGAYADDINNFSGIRTQADADKLNLAIANSENKETVNISFSEDANNFGILLDNRVDKQNIEITNDGVHAVTFLNTNISSSQKESSVVFSNFNNLIFKSDSDHYVSASNSGNLTFGSKEVSINNLTFADKTKLFVQENSSANIYATNLNLANGIQSRKGSEITAEGTGKISLSGDQSSISGTVKLGSESASYQELTAQNFVVGDSGNFEISAKDSQLSVFSVAEHGALTIKAVNGAEQSTILSDGSENGIEKPLFSIKGKLTVEGGNLETTGQLYVSNTGIVSLGSDQDNFIKNADIQNLNSAGKVDIYARDLSFTQRVGAAGDTANVTIHKIAADQTTVFNAGALAGNGGHLTVEAGEVASFDTIQANADSKITLGSADNQLSSFTANADNKANNNALLRANENAELTVNADKVNISQTSADLYAVSSFGGNIAIKSDDIKITGKLSSGVVEDTFLIEPGSEGYREEYYHKVMNNSRLSIESATANGATVIEGDILTYNNDTSTNTVSIFLQGENSALTGAIQNRSAEDDKVIDLASEEQGTKLSLSNGATWNVTGKSEVASIESSTGIINADGNDVTIHSLTNQGDGTTINTSSLNKGHIGIDSNQGAGLNIALSSKATDALPGSSDGNMQAMLDVADIQKSDSCYTITAQEGSLIGESKLYVNADGSIASYGETINTVVQGMKDVAAMNYLMFRSQMNDVQKRMGDLRVMPKESGVWTRYYGGELEYGNSKLKNRYNTLQIGADYRLGENFYVGGALSYTDDNGTLYNGSSDGKQYSFGLYGGWFGADGQYVDVIIKRHRLETDFDLNNTSGILNHGSYSTWATSLSAEAGWRFGILNSGFYVEPQVELSLGYIESTDYRTNQGVDVNQDSIKSVVGRIGTAIGYVFPENHGSIYARASALHDWQGDIRTDLRYKGQNRSYTDDLGGTSGEFALGGTYNASDSFSAYGELQTLTGSPVDGHWQISLGLRYAF